MISLTAALETCEYELICITLHIDEEKSTDTIERFNVFFFKFRVLILLLE